jgi:hypothetical protein
MRYILVLLTVFVLISGCVDLSSVEIGDAPPEAIPVSNCTGPICAENGQTYPTDCDAADAGLAIIHWGSCIGCNETDSGIDIYRRGNSTSDQGSFLDKCENESILKEYYCDEGLIRNALIPCGQMMACHGGICKTDDSYKENQTENDSFHQDDAPDQVAACTGPAEPDPYSLDETIYNNITHLDECVDYKIVKDYYCQDGSLLSLNSECDPGDRCAGGVCVPVLISCEETDGGNDTFNRGTTTASKGIHTFFSKTDECIDQGTILEHMCSNAEPVTHELRCDSGYKCQAGRCVESDCNDTDGGMDIFTKGEVIIDDAVHEDDCVDETKIEEFYCYGDDFLSISERCPDGYICMMDECIPE